MTRSEQLVFLIRELKPGAKVPENEAEQWSMFRSLVNLRRPGPVSDAFIKTQDALLKAEIAAKGVTQPESLEPVCGGVYLWRGDITTLAADAVVNAANSGLTGCYCPCHHCVDNAIHTYAGVQLRNACAQIIARQGHAEPVGQAKITAAYNLPSRFVIHTVGPFVAGPLTEAHCAQLAACYRACLETAAKNHLTSLAFCSVSTGEFHFPNQEAAQIAVQSVQAFLQSRAVNMRVIFNVFKNSDEAAYRRCLGKRQE